ncbi:hypothetical protein LSH36_399g04010 [Paralvinella palmiformis]|uniref:Uncharacterized protein n=1 Tax=Paralvinella palmiformis TaxID=53620 RepID=A0AAD9JDY9_9ANNE|nr:hypothetical protein LSH36_399g04010 [Paralvinella palmiformis]
MFISSATNQEDTDKFRITLGHLLQACCHYDEHNVQNKDDVGSKLREDEESGSDAIIDISGRARSLMATMAAIDPKPSLMASPKKDTADYVMKRTTLVRTMIARQNRVTSHLRNTLSDIEETERELERFLKNERERGMRSKYKVLESPEDFVCQYEKYSMEDFL